ncbi:MAG: complex I NDUFA9 subunit family protein [Gammaproteobacteria bacterium]
MRELKICVLGGTGFVGRRLVARLAGMGHRIRVPTRSRARNRRMLVLSTVTLVTEDVHDPATLERAFEGMDAVVNLIAILNERGRDGSGFRRVHTELAEKVIAACRAKSVHRLLHVSALNADAGKGPSLYLKTKGEAENALRERCGEALAWTIFQPSVIFGAEDSFTNRFARLLKLSPVLPLARPDARFAPVYVENVAHAIVQSIEDRATHRKTYELCGPRVYTLREIVEFLRRTLGIRRMVIGLPDSLSRLQAKVMDFVPGKPFSTDNYLSLTVDSVCRENGLAHFDIEPNSMEGIVPRYLNRTPD